MPRQVVVAVVMGGLHALVDETSFKKIQSKKIPAFVAGIFYSYLEFIN